MSLDLNMVFRLDQGCMFIFHLHSSNCYRGNAVPLKNKLKENNLLVKHVFG